MSSPISGRYADDTKRLAAILRVNECFDVVQKTILLANRPASLFFVDGFCKDETMEKILEFWMKATPKDLQSLPTTQLLADRLVSYVETDVEGDFDRIVTAVLSGKLALLVAGYPQAILIDARTYPVRGVAEPDDDRVLRGARDGFVETLVFNTALIRRRIRDPRLTMEIFQVGEKSKTDIVLCYMQGLPEKRVLQQLRDRIGSITIGSLSMGQESLAECLIKRQWYNPFPRIRYTERPDSAAACVLEGKILVIVDNSPSVMILPCSLFDFGQDTNDFYFPPLVGTYLRLVRLIIFALTIFLTPMWYLLIRNPEWIPPRLEFLLLQDPVSIPIIVQLLLLEFIVDGLKLASLNTPSVLSNSFSVVGALILGDFAIQAGWFSPEVVLYMAFVAIANFTQPSFELGYAFKLFRMLILVLTALFNLWGFLAGIACMLLVAATTKTVTGRCYLFPLVPFNAKAFLSLFVRQPIDRTNS